MREIRKIVKSCLLCTFIVLIQPKLFAQETLALEDAYALVENNYPLAGQRQLNTQLSEINQQLLDKERFPVVRAKAEGTLQSDNISLAGDLPFGLDLPLESYKAYLDINYSLYDGGIVKAQRELEEAQLNVTQQNLEVRLRTLKDRVNQLFFAIQLSRQQQQLLSTSINDIETNMATMKAGLANGVVLESEVAKLQVRKLELQSDSVKLLGDVKAYFSVLERLTGKSLSTTTELKLPNMTLSELDTAITRPEQQLYQFQQELIRAKEATISADKRPKLMLFAQGGIGYPNPLNFPDISNSLYALGGLRLDWKLIDWGKANREREKLQVQVLESEADRKTFEFDITSQQREYMEKVVALRVQLENDQQIVTLQQQILEQTEVQLQEGVINSNDYLIQVNAELAAKQKLELHKVQLQQLQITYLTLIGKL
ncbi:TolC family protein [Limibacter armeniacum]|uniref:TolC family protein n=1 Tax=Limibacter armeniacum TaxID=466084 RepID=UPI002FE66E9D